MITSSHASYLTSYLVSIQSSSVRERTTSKTGASTLAGKPATNNTPSARPWHQPTEAKRNATQQLLLLPLQVLLVVLYFKMVKHNNVIPNIHCHKKYLASSRGPLKVKLALNQASKKKTRRLARAKKAAAIAPAPLQKLRPIVHCPTQKYSAKTKLGKGFTLDELKAAGLAPKYAQTIGIAVDFRRTNKSQESFDLNVARLTSYKSNLVILKKGQDASGLVQLKGAVQPIDYSKPALEMQEITDEMKSYKAFTTMRVARQETRVDGYRASVANRKEKK